jgi:phosphoacetylglucosamine mutase
VKIVDPSGEMLDTTWESHATALSNCPNTSSLISTFTTLATHLRVDLSAPASIAYARDTRPSGPELVAALERGFSVFPGIKLVDVGVTTTPVLHHVVKATNDRTGRTGKPSSEGYYSKLAHAFTALIVSRLASPRVIVLGGLPNGIELIHTRRVTVDPFQSFMSTAPTA